MLRAIARTALCARSQILEALPRDSNRWCSQVSSVISRSCRAPESSCGKGLLPAASPGLLARGQIKKPNATHCWCVLQHLSRRQAYPEVFARSLVVGGFSRRSQTATLAGRASKQDDLVA